MNKPKTSPAAPVPPDLHDLAASLPELMSVREAAKIVRRSPQTLLRAAKRGDLLVRGAGPGRGGRGPALVSRSSLLAWVARWQRVGA